MSSLLPYHIQRAFDREVRICFDDAFTEQLKSFLRVLLGVEDRGPGDAEVAGCFGAVSTGSLAALLGECGKPRIVE